MLVSWVFGYLCRGGSMAEGIRGGVGVSILSLLDLNRGSGRILNIGELLSALLVWSAPE